MHTYVPCYEEPFYLKSKAVRRGELVLPEEDKEILQWIKQKYGITAHCFDFKEEDSKVRVDLMLDVMADGPRLGYPREELVARFRTFLVKNPQRFALNDSRELFVFSDSFERIATEEMLHQFKENELDKLPVQFKCIANVHSGPRSYTVFYKTDAQLTSGKTDGTNQAIIDYVYQSLKKYDPFNYCLPDTIDIIFDSTEHVDRDYNGKWIDYYR
jgi:hypothetical protein